jgi:hypothetical protein
VLDVEVEVKRHSIKRLMASKRHTNLKNIPYDNDIITFVGWDHVQGIVVQ